MLIDPPSGWRYGFPKPYVNPDNKPLEDWLLENGYPQFEIDLGMAKHCRFIASKKEEFEDLVIEYKLKEGVDAPTMR